MMDTWLYYVSLIWMDIQFRFQLSLRTPDMWECTVLLRLRQEWHCLAEWLSDES